MYARQGTGRITGIIFYKYDIFHSAILVILILFKYLLLLFRD